METNQVWSKGKAEFIDQRKSHSFSVGNASTHGALHDSCLKNHPHPKLLKGEILVIQREFFIHHPRFIVLDLCWRLSPKHAPLQPTHRPLFYPGGCWDLAEEERLRGWKSLHLKIRRSTEQYQMMFLVPTWVKFKNLLQKIPTNQCWPWFLLLPFLQQPRKKKNRESAWIEHCILDIQTNLEILHLSHQSQLSPVRFTAILTVWCSVFWRWRK